MPGLWPARRGSSTAGGRRCAVLVCVSQSIATVPRFAGPLLRRTSGPGSAESAGSADAGGSAAGAVLLALQATREPVSQTHAQQNARFANEAARQGRPKPEVYPQTSGRPEVLKHAGSLGANFGPNFCLVDVLHWGPTLMLQ